MHRGICGIAVQFLLVGLPLPGIAGPQAPSGAGPSRPTFEIRWTSDSHYENVFSAHFEFRAKYEITGIGKLGALRWVEGGLVTGKGRMETKPGEYDTAVYEDASPAGTIGLDPAALKANLESAGEINEVEGSDKVEIVLHVVPGFDGVSGPTDEARACYATVRDVGHHDPYKLELTQEEFSQLPELHKAWPAWTVERNPYNGCSETFTVSINLWPLKLEYDQTNLDTAVLAHPCGEEVDQQVYIMKGGGGESWEIHGNFAGKVLVDGANKVQINPGPPPCGHPAHPVTSDYKIHRDRRPWAVDSSRTLGPNQGWGSDITDPIQDWIDDPAVPFLNEKFQEGATVVQKLPPAKWPREGTLDEFLVRVEGWPGCGCIYIAFLLEIKPGAYRIKYSAPEEIDETTWKERKQSPEPAAKLAFQGDEDWVYLQYDKQKKSWKTTQTAPKPSQ